MKDILKELWIPIVFGLIWEGIALLLAALFNSTFEVMLFVTGIAFILIFGYIILR